MTDPVVSIEPAEHNVEPGGQVHAQVTVRNPGSIVEGYRLEILGERPDQGPPSWAEVHPAELRVFPKETGTAAVVFAVPDGGTSASGRFPFGVRVTSTVTSDVSAVAEGDLEVGRVFGLQSTITPMTSSGRWRGYHVLRYTNWGNAPVHLSLRATDPDERLGFLLRPTEVNLPLGGSAQVRLTVRTRKPFLRGTSVRLPFEVVGEQDGVRTTPPPPAHVADPQRPVATGALMQKPILSRATVAIAGLAAAAVAGALVLALKTPKSAPSFENLGAPPPPTTLSAQALKNGAIGLNWRPARDVEAYKVLTLQGTGVVATTKIDGQLSRYVTPPLSRAKRYCFTLESVRGKLQSGRSQVACKTTAAPPPTSSSPTGGSGSPTTTGGASTSSGSPSNSPSTSPSGSPIPKFNPGDYIVVIGTIYDDSLPNAESQARAAAAGLSSVIAASVVHTSDYPNWVWRGSLISHPFWAVYTGPFGASEATTTLSLCQADHLTCANTQPAGP